MAMRVPPRYSDFYPRPPRGGRPGDASVRYDDQKISIHALREEGDSAPLGMYNPSTGFLSTPSARRATTLAMTLAKTYKISIHALREEGDTPQRRQQTGHGKFLSTPSARRAT